MSDPEQKLTREEIEELLDWKLVDWQWQVIDAVINGAVTFVATDPRAHQLIVGAEELSHARRGAREQAARNEVQAP